MALLFTHAICYSRKHPWANQVDVLVPLIPDHSPYAPLHMTPLFDASKTALKSSPSTPVKEINVHVAHCSRCSSCHFQLETLIHNPT